MIDATSPQRKIRLGILGASANPFAWASAAHIPALKSLPEYEIVAVASRTQENADAAAAKHGIPRAYGDYHEMIRQPDIDMIIVSTSSEHHHRFVMPAIEAGKHVFCEWPFGMNMAQATEMRDAARAKGVRTLVGLQNRCAPIVAYVRDLIAQGYIGTLWSVNFDRANDQTAQMNPSQAYIDFLEHANAGLRIMGGHALDTLAAYVGEMQDLQAYMEIGMKEIAIDTGVVVPVSHKDHILIQGRLAGGAVVSVVMKQNSPTYKAFQMEISGSRGAIIITTEGDLDHADRHPGVPTDYILFGTSALGQPFERLSIPNQYRTVPTDTPDSQALAVAHMYQMFSRAYFSDTRCELDFDQGVKRHELLETIVKAAETGERQAV